jgi:hypothetical protein
MHRDDGESQKEPERAHLRFPLAALGVDTRPHWLQPKDPTLKADRGPDAPE